MSPTDLLIDYGGVISHLQPATSLTEMAGAAGMDSAAFVQRYWEHRADYDRGAAAADYWAAVLGRALPLGDPVLATLTRLDLASWTELNDDTLRVLAQAHAHGVALSLLSNAPHQLADFLDAHPAFTLFDRLVFSARLGIAKPDPGAFHAALTLMDRPPGQVLFVDDRSENVAAAAEVGLHVLRFTTAGQLARTLNLGA